MERENISEAQPLAAFLEESDDDLESPDTVRVMKKAKGNISSNLFVALIGTLLMSLNVLSGWLGAEWGRQRVNLDAKCAAYTAHYSPVLEEVEIKYAFRQFNGSFMKQEIFRLPGSPDVDAAWESLGVDYRAGIISMEDGLRSGLTPAHVQRADQYGGGFFVNVEGMHHLHCLNLLRKSLYYNYNYYRSLGTHAFSNEEDILQLHISHCLDTLRQVLMCNVDTGVLGQVWYNRDKPTPFPDFNTRHKCKNFDKVKEWAGGLQAPPPDTVPTDFLKQPDPDNVLLETP